MPRYAKVTAEVWVDLERLQQNEEDLEFDLSDDAVEDARYLIESRLDSVTALADLRVSAKETRRRARS